MERIFVSDIMTRDPITASPEINLLECAKKMVKKHVGSLLLVQNKRLVGFISRKDILWALTKKSQNDLSKIKAIDISPRKIATIKPNASIDFALNKMKKVKFGRLPVIKEGELVGLLTIKDILNFNPEIYPELEEFKEIRDEANKLKRIKKAKDRSVTEGVCEECGNYDELYRANGVLICASCMGEL